MKNLVQKIFLFVCIVIVVVCTSSCYSGNIHLQYDPYCGAVRNVENVNEIAFIASTSAYRPATGISRFPDGGQPKYIFQKVSLYCLNTETHQIINLVDFSDLAELIGTSKTKWKTKIIFKGPFVFYHVSPVTSWALHSKWKKNSISNEVSQQLQNKYEKYYKINILSKQIREINLAEFQNVADNFFDKTKISLTKLNDELQKTKLSEFYLILDNIEDKSDDEYIKNTIYLKNDSEVSRRAVIEQIISKRSREEIQSLLNKMDQYKKSLKRSKRIQYEISSEGIYAALQSLLKKGCENLVEAAKKELQNEDFIEADKIYRKAIDCDPDNPRIWNDFGECNYKGGRIETADSAFAQALEINLNFAPAWRNLGIMAMDNENYLKALEYLQKAKKLDPSDKLTNSLLDKLRDEFGVVTEQDL